MTANINEEYIWDGIRVKVVDTDKVVRPAYVGADGELRSEVTFHKAKIEYTEPGYRFNGMQLWIAWTPNTFQSIK